MMDLIFSILIVFVTTMIGWLALRAMRGDAQTNALTSFFYCVIFPVSLSAALYALMY